MEGKRKIELPDSVSLDDVHSSKHIPKSNNDGSKNDKISIHNFRSYAPENKCIFELTSQLWPVSSVDARIGKIETGSYDKNGNKQYIKATDWLAKNRSVEQMTWIPGKPKIMKNQLVIKGEIVETIGTTCYNLYKPPIIELGDPNKAMLWLEHLHNIYPESAEHIIKWLAHRVQYPGEKINHALVLGGNQGIGKDTLLEPVSHAVGPWNMADVSPNQLMGRFNGFIQSVILRVSEARDLGDNDRYKLYEHMKTFTASPPMALRCDEKNKQEYEVPNLCGVIITTNHKISGIYIPADDRRHYVAWSEKNKDDFDENYWQKLWTWYKNGGINHVAAYLHSVDLTRFDPKSPPPKTDAFWEIVDSNRPPEDAELADALDKLENPPVVTINMIADKAEHEFKYWLLDRKNNRQIPHRLETAGYIKVPNETPKDRLWSINGKRSAIYAKKDLSKAERLEAAKNLIVDTPF